MVVMSERFSLRVPSSTSNLGPGFDFLGLCLGLFLEAEVDPLLSRYADIARTEAEIRV